MQRKCVKKTRFPQWIRSFFSNQCYPKLSRLSSFFFMSSGFVTFSLLGFQPARNGFGDLMISMWLRIRRGRFQTIPYGYSTTITPVVDLYYCMKMVGGQ